MLFFLTRRVAHSLPMLFLLSLLVFSLFKLIPGDYLSEMELNPAIHAFQDLTIRKWEEYLGSERLRSPASAGHGDADLPKASA